MSVRKSTIKTLRNQFSSLRSSAPVIIKVFFLMIILEIFTSLVAPMIIPDSWYLKWYLGERSIARTKQFLTGEIEVVPHEIIGWVNKPGIKKKNWIIDEHGSRSTHPIKIDRLKPIRVVFLGSSLVNGGMEVRNNETISAYLEGDQLETINFGTMMHTLDQSLLLYKYRVKNYNADIVIVGIEADAVSGIKNHYIPFRFRHEVNMPLLKNRFILSSGSIKLINLSIRKELSSIPDNNELLDFLSDNDGFYYRYDAYRRFGFLPLTGGINRLYFKLDNFLKYFRQDSEGYQLLETLVRELEIEANKLNALIIILYLPNRKVYERGGIYKYLPDRYGEEVKKINLTDFNIVDARQIFRQSGKKAEKLFQRDRIHYKPIANRLIARTLKTKIKKLLKSRKRQRNNSLAAQ
jgi:hypothetical protein